MSLLLGLNLISVDGETSDSATPRKLFFADIHIVAEVKPEGTCADEHRITERVEEGFKVELTEDKRLLRKLGKKSVDYYALNVVFQKLNFDTGRYQFSVLDGVVPDMAPHKFRIRRRPGNILDLYYLDQVFNIQLNQSPVYSFTAKETRGKCELTHTLNVFTEKNGYYLPQDI